MMLVGREGFVHGFLLFVCGQVFIHALQAHIRCKRLGNMLLHYITLHYIVQIRRTVKFLGGAARGVAIVTPQWLNSSKSSGMFVGESVLFYNRTCCLKRKTSPFQMAAA